MIKVGIRVFCDEIDRLYDTYKDQIIQIPTTDSWTWKMAKIKQTKAFGQNDFGYAISCSGYDEVFPDPKHLFNHTKACEYKPSQRLPINRTTFHNWFNEEYEYCHGFFLGLFATESCQENMMIETGNIRKVLADHILSVLRQLGNFHHTIYMSNGDIGSQSRNEMVRMSIQFLDTDLIKELMACFFAPKGSMWNCLLYHQNFRRGVLEGFKARTECWDTNFDTTVTHLPKKLAHVMRAIDVSLGRICLLEDRENDLHCWLIDDGAAIQDEYNACEVIKGYPIYDAGPYGYSFVPEELINGSLILPNGVLSDIIQGE